MKRAAAGGLVICAVLYAVLAVLAHLHRYFAFDLSIALALQQLRSAPLDLFMRAASWPGYSPQFVPELALVLLALYLLRLRIEAVIMTVAELGVAVQGFVLKPIVGRPRPSTGLIWVNDHLRQDPYTFTAGHVHTFTVIFGFIAFLAWRRMRPGDWRRKAIIAGSVVILVVVGISRIYLGDHWASDVLGGYLAGGMWLGVAILLYRLLLERGIVRETDR